MLRNICWTLTVDICDEIRAKWWSFVNKKNLHISACFIVNDARNYHEQIIYVQIKESYFQQHHLDLYYRDYIKEVQITEPCGTPAYTLRLDNTNLYAYLYALLSVINCSRKYRFTREILYLMKTTRKLSSNFYSTTLSKITFYCVDENASR